MMFLPSLLVLVPSTATAFIARQHTVPTTLPRTGRKLNAATPKFSPTKSCLFQTGNDNNGEEEEIFFDDFDFVIGGSGSNDYNANIPDTSLQERIQASQQEELKRETKLLQNWKTGDWSVRGFSLDPADALSEEQSSFQPQDGSQPQETNSPIYVSKVVPDVNSQGTRIWVGRSNGSLVWVQLGQEYLAHFQSKITGTFIDDADNTGTNDDEDAPSSASARFQSKLVRESSQSPSTPNDDRPVTTPAAPFQVLAQCSANQGESAISNILPVPEEDLIFITCRGNGQIQQWHISEEDAESDTQALSSPVPLSEGIHNDEIVALKLIYYQNAPLLFSVSCDGSLAIWDAQKGDLVYHCKVNVDDIGNPEGDQGNDTVTQVIHCADVNEDQIFLGTTTGFVLGYLVSDLLNSASSGGACPLPRGKFKADDGGVTAIACGGPGSLGRGQDTSSVVLITGGANGLVKQWEILTSPSSPRMESWPKLANQRLPKKAHIFEGHYGPITALETMGGRRPQFLSASQDGTIRAWDVAKGKEQYKMEGFTTDLSSLCLQGAEDYDDDLLITNGMNQYVCVHDFSAGMPEESIDDFLEPWDDQ